jgi:hypothetical protein
LVAVAESFAVPALPGLAVTAVEWLPSGAESGLIRVRGRWTEEHAREPDLPVLALRAGGGEHRFDSLPDARFSREPDTWRGTYLVPAELVATDPEALWLEWPSGSRAGLPPLSRGVEPPPVPAAPERPEEPDEPGGQVIDRAVLAERRARRAEAAEEAQARVAAEALKAVEVLELRSAELERRLEEAVAERDALTEGGAGRREALAAALASAAALRSRSREWQVRLRSTEVARAGDAVRLAVLDAERASGAAATRSALHEARGEAESTRSALEAAHSEAESMRSELEERGQALETARDEAESMRSALDQRGHDLETARREAVAVASELAAATGAATAARADLEATSSRFAEARAAWDRRREELETALSDVQGQLEAAREEAAAHSERSAADADQLREHIGALEAALAVAEGRIQTSEGALAAAETRLHVETVARTTLEDEVDREHAELERLRSELEAEREARHAAEQALATARAQALRTGTTLQDRIAELERRAAAVPELERLAREHTPEHEPAADAGRLVADLDAAADALRRRGAPDEPPAPPVLAADPAAPLAPASAESEPEPPVLAADPAAPLAPASAESEPEPPAPDAEPAVEWAEPVDAPPREPCTPGVQPARPKADPDETPPWMPPGLEPWVPAEGGEPPAPDAEPTVESAPPEEPPASEQQAPPADASAALPQPPLPEAPQPPAVSVAPPDAKTAGPIIVPAPGPPARALATGSHRREYPLLRGALVKLAHDDPATTAALLVALLPTQGAAIEGPVSYDLTIREAGTFGIGIAAGRASVEQIDFPRPRGISDFHLTADAVILAELLAGVEHRIGRFFGPVRVRGRKRRVKQLKALPSSTATLAEIAHAGARLDPGLVYRLLSYAIHPSWTRGHDFTIAQEVTGAPPETWYLTARDGAGVTASGTAPAEPPDATVTMSRQVFDRLLRQEPIPSGRLPVVRGDHAAVAAMHAWTLRVQGR